MTFQIFMAQDESLKPLPSTEAAPDAAEGGEEKSPALEPCNYGGFIQMCGKCKLIGMCLG